MSDQYGRLPVVFDEVNANQPLPSKLVAEGEYLGHRYEVRYYQSPQHPDSAPTLVVTLLKPSMSLFGVVRMGESAGSRDLLRFLFRRRAHSRDEHFDRKYYVEDSAPTAATEICIRSAAGRAAIDALFDRGVKLIRNDGKGVDAVWLSYSGGETADPAFVAGALGYLAVLASADSELGIPPPAPLWRSYAAVFIWVVPGVVALGALALSRVTFTPVDEQAAMVYGVLVSIPFVALAAAVVTWLLRGRKQTLYFRCLAYFVSALFTWSGTSTAWELLNAVLDKGPATRHVVPVVTLEEGGSRASPHVRVVDWRNEQELRRVYLTDEEFDWAWKITGGKTLERPVLLEVRVKPGFFGVEWIAERRLIPKDTATQPTAH